MLVPEVYRDSFDLVPRPPRFAPTAPGAFRFALDNDYANKHAEHKTAISCRDGGWLNNNLAQHGAALSEKSFGIYTIAAQFASNPALMENAREHNEARQIAALSTS